MRNDHRADKLALRPREFVMRSLCGNEHEFISEQTLDDPLTVTLHVELITQNGELYNPIVTNLRHSFPSNPAAEPIEVFRHFRSL